MPIQPVFSLFTTASVGYTRRKTDLESAKDYVRFANLQMITELDVWLSASAWPADPLFLVMGPDGDAIVAATASPVFWMPVQHQVAATAAPVNQRQFVAPFAQNQYDFLFTHTAPDPSNGGTVILAAGLFEFTLTVFGPPTAQAV